MGNNMALFDGIAKIYVRARVEAHRAWCQDLSPSTVRSAPAPIQIQVRGHASCTHLITYTLQHRRTPILPNVNGPRP